MHLAEGGAQHGNGRPDDRGNARAGVVGFEDCREFLERRERLLRRHGFRPGPAAARFAAEYSCHRFESGHVAQWDR